MLDLLFLLLYLDSNRLTTFFHILCQNFAKTNFALHSIAKSLGKSEWILSCSVIVTNLLSEIITPISIKNWWNCCKVS